MRFWATEGDLYSYADAYASTPEIEPGYTHRMEVLDDGTVTTFSECSGPPETVREVIGGAEQTIDIIVSNQRPPFYYLHFEPTPTERQMMEATQKTSLALKGPVEPQEDGSVVATYVGDQEDVGDAYELVPDGVNVEVVHIRDAVTDSDDLFSSLTARQREVLATAVEMGTTRTHGP